MTKQELIDAIANETGETKSAISRILDGLGKAATSELSKGGEVSLPNLGKLVTTQRAGREGRNPQTGAIVQIAASTAVKFKTSQHLKSALN